MVVSKTNHTFQPVSILINNDVKPYVHMASNMSHVILLYINGI